MPALLRLSNMIVGLLKERQTLSLLRPIQPSARYQVSWRPSHISFSFLFPALGRPDGLGTSGRGEIRRLFCYTTYISSLGHFLHSGLLPSAATPSASQEVPYEQAGMHYSVVLRTIEAVRPLRPRDPMQRVRGVVPRGTTSGRAACFLQLRGCATQSIFIAPRLGCHVPWHDSSLQTCVHSMYYRRVLCMSGPGNTDWKAQARRALLVCPATCPHTALVLGSLVPRRRMSLWPVTRERVSLDGQGEEYDDRDWWRWCDTDKARQTNKLITWTERRRAKAARLAGSARARLHSTIVRCTANNKGERKCIQRPSKSTLARTVLPAKR